MQFQGVPHLKSKNKTNLGQQYKGAKTCHDMEQTCYMEAVFT